MDKYNIITKLRQESGIRSRAEFGRAYGIPVRTLENWESGVNSPADYVVDLLARAVWNDREGANVWFRVCSRRPGQGDEFEDLKTRSYIHALSMASTVRDNGYETEVRVYAEDIDEEGCMCFDYDTIDF